MSAHGRIGFVGRRSLLRAGLLAMGALIGMTAGWLGQTGRPVAVATSDACDWSCCRPLTLGVHSTAHAVPDPDQGNDPNITDIVWQRMEADNQVPVRFRVRYCPAYVVPGQSCATYEGLIPVNRGNPPQIVKLNTWPAKARISECGQEGAPLDEIVQFAPWMADPAKNWPTTICGTDANIDQFLYPDLSCFVCSDYFLQIARNILPMEPNHATLCFQYIEVWVDPQTADLSTKLIQHVFSSDTQNPCLSSDEYYLLSTPHTKIRRTDFTQNGPHPAPRPCEPAVGAYPGGHYSETCIFAVFQHNNP